MIEHSNREAREISDRAGDIYNTVCLLGDRLQALGSSMTTATQRYNEAVRAVQGRQGLLGKVARFKTVSKKASKTFPKNLAPIDPEIENLALENRDETELDTND
jgi:DNA recombination protein RmuC